MIPLLLQRYGPTAAATKITKNTKITKYFVVFVIFVAFVADAVGPSQSLQVTDDGVGEL
jgi:hypothetical protein